MRRIWRVRISDLQRYLNSEVVNKAFHVFLITVIVIIAIGEFVILFLTGKT